jgi:hypothetical protein
LDLFKSTFHYQNQDFENWKKEEEEEYLSGLQKTPEHTASAIAYVEKLQNLKDTQYVLANVFDSLS